MKKAKTKFVSEFSESLRDGNASIFVGAGVSMAAGYPSWIKLLREIGQELGVESKDVHDLAALAQWSIHAHKGDGRIKDVINKEISPIKDIPAEALSIARLPVRHIWTTNYDRVIERAFEKTGRPLQAISSPRDLSRKLLPNATRLYKMHGSITDLSDIVISTDDYELFNSKRGAFTPILQAHLTTMSMLFLGISFSDPNIKHILAMIRERFHGSAPSHFAIMRPPHREDFDSDAEFEARKKQHELWSDDLERYGLHVVEVADYAEVGALLHDLERSIASDRVWISGSWPPGSDGSEQIGALAHEIGRQLALRNKNLVTGYGLVVGSSSIAGFLEGLRDSGVWGVSDRLIARPFPQPDQVNSNVGVQWDSLREEMARLSGIVIVIGGKKDEGGADVIANGVLKEVGFAIAQDAMVIPIGLTGGAAKAVAKMLLSQVEINHRGVRVRPSDHDLEILSDERISNEDLLDKIMTLIFEE